MCPNCQREDPFCLCLPATRLLVEYHCHDCSAVRIGGPVPHGFIACPECDGPMTQWSVAAIHPDDVIAEAMRIISGANKLYRQNLVLCVCGHSGTMHFFKSIDHAAGCNHCENDDDRAIKCTGYKHASY